MQELVAGASEQGASEPASLFFTVGPGAAPEFEGSDSYQPIPFTVLRYGRGGVSFETEGLGGRLDVIPDSVSKRFGAGPSFAFRLAREDTDDAVLDALTPVGTAVEVGGFVRYTDEPGWLPQDSLEVRLTVNADTSGAHDGVLAEVDADYAWFVRENVRCSVGLRGSMASDRFFDAYFGDSEADALASGLDAFDPDAGLRSVGAQASCLFLFNPNHGVFGLVRYDQLVGDAADSPVVRDAGDDSQWLVGVGYSYRF